MNMKKHEYINCKIRPLFEGLVVDLLIHKPDKVKSFMIDWLQNHVDSLPSRSLENNFNNEKTKNPTKNQKEPQLNSNNDVVEVQMENKEFQKKKEKNEVLNEQYKLKLDEDHTNKENNELLQEQSKLKLAEDHAIEENSEQSKLEENYLKTNGKEEEKIEGSPGEIIDKNSIQENKVLSKDISLYINSQKTPTTTINKKNKTKKENNNLNLEVIVENNEKNELEEIKKKLKNYEDYNEENVIKINKLGEGGFGIVHEVFHKSSKIFMALKELKIKELDDIFNIKDEVKILKLMKDKEIIYKNYLDFYGIYKNPTFDKCYLEMELGVTDLKKIINYRTNNGIPYNLSENLYIMKSLLRDYDCLEQKGIAHCDVKPDNVIVVESNNDIYYKICDFGIGDILKKGEKTRDIDDFTAWTYRYASPELKAIVNKTFQETTYNPFLSDVFSLGIFFKNDLFSGLITNTQEIDTEKRKIFDIIKTMLEEDYLKRPTFSELLNLMEKIDISSYLPFREFEILNIFKKEKESTVINIDRENLIENLIRFGNKLLKKNESDKIKEIIDQLINNPILYKNKNLHLNFLCLKGDFLLINENYKCAIECYEDSLLYIFDYDKYVVSLTKQIILCKLVFAYDCLNLINSQNNFKNNKYFIDLEKNSDDDNFKLLSSRIIEIQSILELHEELKNTSLFNFKLRYEEIKNNILNYIYEGGNIKYYVMNFLNRTLPKKKKKKKRDDSDSDDS